MKNLKKIFVASVFAVVAQMSWAQIGYQVSLLNSATGEPRANETVSVFVQITNSVGESIYGQTQSATTNDFGILSLAIGNANMFNNVDWSKRPLFISATVDGKFLGKTQILTVPVAGYARNSSYSELANYADTASYARTTGVLTKEKLEGTWNRIGYNEGTYTFTADGTFSGYISPGEGYKDKINGKYFVDGNHLLVYYYDEEHGTNGWLIYHYLPEMKILITNDGESYYIKVGDTEE